MDIESARKTIRETGLRATGPRVAVLCILSEARQALTHGDVVGKLRDQVWDASTIYRNLQDLTEAGLFRRTEQGDRLWRYELRGDDGGHLTRHPHFICVDCGDVRCLPEMTIAAGKGERIPHAVKAAEVEIQVRGVCDTCRA